MKSDKQLYKLFGACPQLIDAFMPLEKEAIYHFGSRTFKELERTVDGVLESDDESVPTMIIEFQMKYEKDIYARTILEMAAYQLEKSGREVKGLIVFGSKTLDPKQKPWRQFSQTCQDHFRVLYLDKAIEELPTDHVLVATFKPFLEKNQEILAQQAAQCLRIIRAANLEPPQKHALEDVFISWITQRYKNLSRKEINQMVVFDVPLEETVFYKEAYGEGKHDGEIKGKIERLKYEIASFGDLFSKGRLPESVYHELLDDRQKTLLDLETQIAKLGEA